MVVCMWPKGSNQEEKNHYQKKSRISFRQVAKSSRELLLPKDPPLGLELETSWLVFDQSEAVKSSISVDLETGKSGS